MLTSKQYNDLAVVALTVSIRQLTKNLKPAGRLRTLLDKLYKKGIWIIHNKFPEVNDYEMGHFKKIIFEFGEGCEWENEERALPLVVSLCADIMPEGVHYKELGIILADIYDYFARVDNVYPADSEIAIRYSSIWRATIKRNTISRSGN